MEHHRKRELEVRQQLQGLLTHLESRADADAHPLLYVSAMLSAIVFELTYDYRASTILDYYYWNALEDVLRPGKFERAHAYVAFFYQATLDGWQTGQICYEDGGCMWYFDNAKDICPWHGVPDQVVIAEDSQGFVFEASLEQYYQALDEEEQWHDSTEP